MKMSAGTILIPGKLGDRSQFIDLATLAPEKAAKLRGLSGELGRLAALAPKFSEGAISGNQVARMGSRERATREKNMDRRFEVEAEMRQLAKPDEAVRREVLARDAEKIASRISQIDSIVAFIRAAGKKQAESARPNKVKAEIEKLAAERAGLAAQLAQPQATVRVRQRRPVLHV